MRKLLATFLLLLPCILFAQIGRAPKGLNLRVMGMRDRGYLKAEIFKDLDSVQKLLEHVHPNVYHSRSKEEIDKAFAEAKTKIHASMTRKGYYYVFASLLSEYEDGHLSASPIKHNQNQDMPIKSFLAMGKLLPFEVYHLDHELFVTNIWTTKSTIQKGDILLKINGYKADSLFDVAQKAYAGTPRYQEYYAGKNFAYLLSLLDINPPFNIEYKEGKTGNMAQTTEKGLTDWAINVMERTWGTDEYLDTCQYFSFKIIDNQVAYFKFHRFIGINVIKGTLKDHLKKDFKLIQEKNIQKLVIHMRDNTGGYIRNIDYILAYLTENDYPIIEKMGTKASYESGRIYYGLGGKNRHNLSMKFKDICTKKNILVPIDSIYYTTCLYDTIEHFKNPYIFKGKACVLIGPGTYSAANLGVSIIKTHKLATLIGEATDEPVNDFANPMIFYMPKTGITFTVPISNVYVPERSITDKSTVLPDIEVKTDKTHLSKGEDAVLIKALEWVKK